MRSLNDPNQGSGGGNLRSGLVFAVLLVVLLLGCKPNPPAPTAPAPTTEVVMKQFSYPGLGFQIKFPASWVVSDKRGDGGDYSVEGRETADTPSVLADTKPMSKQAQHLADAAFLKGVRVTVLVQDINRQVVRMNLIEAVSNRIQGAKMMYGTDVDIKPLEQVDLAGTAAFVTTITQKWHNSAVGQISTTTVDYDLDSGTRRYVISIEAPADKFDRYAAEFSNIVHSFILDGDRQREMAAVWQVVMSRLSDLRGLDEIIDNEAAQDSRGPIGKSKYLILDNGHLRPVNNSDASLSPNHYMRLEYRRDLVHRTSTILAYGDEYSQQPMFSYTLPSR